MSVSGGGVVPGSASGEGRYSELKWRCRAGEWTGGGDGTDELSTAFSDAGVEKRRHRKKLCAPHRESCTAITCVPTQKVHGCGS